MDELDDFLLKSEKCKNGY